jgi:hypothetical protein
MFGKGGKNKRKKTITDEMLLAYYFNVYRIPCAIKSPFRDDRNPSFSFYKSKNGNIRFNDFASGEKGSLLEAIARLKNVDIANVWDVISYDFSSESTREWITDECRTTIVRTERKEFRIKVRRWESYDIDYWASYGINLEFLNEMEVYPISHVFVENRGFLWPHPCDRYAYAYVERKEGFISYKIYQPFNKRGYKWQTNMDKSTIGLWTKLPDEGDIVCICSSYKDAMSLWCNTGIPAVSIQAEGFSMSEHAQNDLRTRFKEVVIILDNDEPGLAYAKKLSADTGFRNVILPPFDGGKDISDLYKTLNDSERFKQKILSLL